MDAGTNKSRSLLYPQGNKPISGFDVMVIEFSSKKLCVAQEDEMPLHSKEDSKVLHGEQSNG